jgi:S-(hydroxymethyl)glutathione synthase
MPSIHPVLDKGFQKGDPDFSGGTLKCACNSSPVIVAIKGNVLHNHFCGCSLCWKPSSALFSLVGVVPKDNVSVTANVDKLKIVNPDAAIQRNACKQCGVHMFGRIVQDHPFKGLDFIHVELSSEKGWQEPQFAAFVSSVIEQGTDASKMGEIRGAFKKAGLETYDCLSPALMDAIASFVAAKKSSSK